MKLCKVIGKAWATVKEESLTGLKIVLACEIDTEGNLSKNIIAAADELGAGEGDTVLISGGSAISNSSLINKPVDSLIVAIVERYTINNK